MSERRKNMDDKNLRKSKVLINNEWVDINPMDIKTGMRFKMFEPDGTPVLFNGEEVFIATSDSFLRKDGIIQTNITTGTEPLYETILN